jgi:hypothetical protein
MDWTGSRSNTGLNVVPPSCDFQTPPDAAPTNTVTFPSFSVRAATAATRPLIAAEPILRTPSPEMVELSTPNAGLGTTGVSASRPEARMKAGEIRMLMRSPCVAKRREGVGTAAWKHHAERHFGDAAGWAGIAKSDGGICVFASAELIVITCLSPSAESFGPDASEKGK